MKSQTAVSEESSAAKRGKLPTLEDQVSHLRKRSYLNSLRLPFFFRLLLTAESLITYALLRTGVTSRAVTVTWFLVGLTAFGIITWGAPWSFAVGACLLYLKIILDLSDGQIGRYQKQLMSVQQDVATHMKGIYLDRIQHAIESPLLGLALGFGVYRFTGNVWILPCGVLIAVFRTFYRFDGLLVSYIPTEFSDRIAAIQKGRAQDRKTHVSRPRRHVVARVLQKLEFWLRNGKRFNLLLLVCGGVDWISSAILSQAIAMQVLLIGTAVVGIGSVVVRILHIQFSDELLRKADE